jgi:hypothetical protein
MPERGLMTGVVGECKLRGAEVTHDGVKTLKVGGVEAVRVGVAHADGRAGENWRELVDCISRLFDR